jgi:predicted unusual protein kinase regulating ubiquinone biosynthesis (AarF/ABC1/UbiB family)
MKGLCHGDLHVGNILFIKDESCPVYKHKICILDFGLVYEIEKTRDAFFYIFSNMCLLPAEEIATKTLLSGILEPVSKIADLKVYKREHYDNIIKIITEFINETVHISHQLSHQNILKIVTELNDYLNNNNLTIDNVKIRPSDDLVKFQVIFAMLHGIILRLCNDTYIELANKVMTELFHVDVSES